jgi:diacylglycerol O-acyltransferase
MMPKTPAPTAKLAHRLTTQDASFLYGESQSAPLHIGSISVFEGEIPFDEMVKFVEGRLHLIPRYRQKLAFVPFNLAHATWEDDPDFKIESHLKQHQVPADSTIEQAIEAALRVHEPPLDRNRPLWEMHLFSGIPNRSILLWKIHHALVDGVSGVELTTVVLDFAPDAAPPPPPEEPWKPRPAPPAQEMIAEAIRDAIQAQIDAARRAREVFGNPETAVERNRLLAESSRVMAQMAMQPIVGAPWNRGPLTQRRRLAMCRYEFSDFRAIRNALGGTVNDVVLAVLTEGAARYLQHHGFRPAGLPLRLGCPVSVRRETEGGALGNRVSMMFPSLPAEPMDMVARLEAVKKETERIKAAREPQGLELMSEAGDAVPPSLMALASAITSVNADAAAAFASVTPPPPISPLVQAPAFGISFIATNVPGVQVPQYLAGHQCLDTVGLLPLGGTLGYGVAIGSYNQRMYFGLMSEPRMMPDVDLMKSYIDEAFSELLKAAGATTGAEPPKTASPDRAAPKAAAPEPKRPGRAASKTGSKAAGTPSKPPSRGKRARAET